MTDDADFLALAEAVADVLADRGLVVAGPPSATRVLDATEVGEILGRDRRWVYDHAVELGGFRFGDGPRARIGFDLATIERWKRSRQLQSSEPRRSAPKRRSRQPARAGANLIPFDASS